jgi:VIT1/CCC1 family predicted Fe2+/Mn2+ transporter
VRSLPMPRRNWASILTIFPIRGRRRCPSAISFTIGALIPLIAILLPPADMRLPVAFISVLLALVLTGTLSAVLGGARKWRAVVRVVLGGAVAMLVTFGIGQLVSSSL